MNNSLKSGSAQYWLITCLNLVLQSVWSVITLSINTADVSEYSKVSFCQCRFLNFLNAKFYFICNTTSNYCTHCFKDETTAILYMNIKWPSTYLLWLHKILKLSKKKVTTKNKKNKRRKTWAVWQSRGRPHTLCRTPCHCCPIALFRNLEYTYLCRHRSRTLGCITCLVYYITCRVYCSPSLHNVWHVYIVYWWGPPTLPIR